MDLVFNLAAQTSHMGGQKDPLADIAVNAVAPTFIVTPGTAPALKKAVETKAQ